MYFDIDTSTLLRTPERPAESRVSYRCLSICVNGGIRNFSNFVCRQFFIDANPLCLLLNKLHLFSLTQRTFILIQLDTPTCMLHVSACTLAILRHVITKPIQRKVQYSSCWCVLCKRSAKCQDEERGFLLSTFCCLRFVVYVLLSTFCCLRSVFYVLLSTFCSKIFRDNGISNSFEYNIGS